MGPAHGAAVYAAAVAALSLAGTAFPAAPVDRVVRVVDGDTILLASERRVRLVQIDSPEVYSESECYGRQSTEAARRLLPPGTRVYLLAEPAADPVDRYGRLLRYVVRVDDGLNVNLRLVELGASAPYFYEGQRGRLATRLESAARRARARRLGLWGACPGTPYDPSRAVTTDGP